MKKIYRKGILGILGLLIIILVIQGLSFYLQQKVKSRITANNIVVSSVSVNLFSRSVKFHDLRWSPPNNPVQHLYLKSLIIKDVHIFKFIVNQNLVIGSVSADSGFVFYNRFVKSEKKNLRPDSFNRILIKEIDIKNLYTNIGNDSIINFSGKISTTLTNVTYTPGIAVDLKRDVERLKLSLDGVTMDEKSSFYRGTATHFEYDSRSMILTIDSAHLIPKYGKFEFARKFGEQTDRIVADVPKITMEGFDFTKIVDSTLAIRSMAINSFNVVAFRDRRLPFLKTKHVPLPMESFVNIPFKISIDSLVVKDSRIVVEEFQIGGTHSDSITFDHVNGTFRGFDNRNTGKGSYATLIAEGLLMNQGKITTQFRFPLDGTPVYTAFGSVSGLSFAKLNPFLEQVNLRVESGELNNLTFDFGYTDMLSTGTLVVNYKDLHIEGLKKDDNSANELKTLLINTVIKTTKNRSVKMSQRTGTINFSRNRNKFIFNYWVKSILDGLASSILGTGNGKRPATTKK